MTDSTDRETPEKETVHFGKRMEGEAHLDFSLQDAPQRSGIDTFLHVLFQLLAFPFRLVGFLFRCLDSILNYIIAFGILFTILFWFLYLYGAGLFYAFAAILGLMHSH